jgi:hypothetical protein
VNPEKGEAMFVYVQHSAGADPVGISEEQQALLLKGGPALVILKDDLEECGIPLDTVTRIDVESGEDLNEKGYPDEDNPGQALSA